MNQVTNIVNQLSEIYTVNDAFPNCVYMYGQKSVGKSLCVEKFIEKFNDIQSVVIHANECYQNQILFETIINAFNKHELSEENGYASFVKVDSMEEFLNQLSLLDVKSSYLIVIEKAERLRDMDMNITPTLMKLQEFTGLNISCIFISHIAIELMGILDLDTVIRLHVPSYNKNDIMEILMTYYESVHQKIVRDIEKSQLDEREKERKLEAASTMDENFYQNYLNTFLNVFYKACRDLKELSFLAEKSYGFYYAPVLNGEIKHNDVTNLWRNVAKFLRISLNSIYMRNSEMKGIKESQENDMGERQSNIKTFAQMLELPYYAKYLLIASFLASHNDAKSDKKLFMKHHGKERRRNQQPKVR